ncbi:MAG: EthD family reductase [Pseudomonadota bacterium]
MYKLIALYKKPDDVDGFLKHYHETHLPLVAKTPGLEKTVLNRVTAAPMGGEPDYFLIAEMHYPDKDAFETAMASEENRAAGKDLMSFAKGLVTLLVAVE